MKDCDTNRRQFLRLMLSMPMAFTIGCDSNLQKSSGSSVIISKLNPEESLKKLILLLGPWSADEGDVAQAFASRFLEAKHTVSPYLPKSSELVQSLASRFSDEPIPFEQINLQNLTTKERELLMKLVKQLYSFIEVRFIVSNEPPWGNCQVDRTRHTRAPILGKSKLHEKPRNTE